MPSNRVGLDSAPRGGSMGSPRRAAALRLALLFVRSRAAAATDAPVDVEKQRALFSDLDVAFDVEEAYFAVFASKSIVSASEDAYQRALVHRDLAKAGVGAGLRPPIELTRAEADLSRFDIG